MANLKPAVLWTQNRAAPVPRTVASDRQHVGLPAVQVAAGSRLDTGRTSSFARHAAGLGAAAAVWARSIQRRGGGSRLIAQAARQDQGENGDATAAPALPAAAVAGLLLGICLLVVPEAVWAADASAGGDWFDPVVDANAALIAGINGVIGSAGMSIILYTVLIKAVTWPLTEPALRANALLKLVAPQTQQINEQYKKDEDSRGRMLSRLYNEVGINPLAAFLPVLIQLPLFIALFRAIGRLAAQNPAFKAGFLWIPSLDGPVESGSPGLDWLLRTRSSDHFEPLVGTEAAVGYCILPVLVIASQIFLQRIGGGANKDQAWIDGVLPWFLGVSCLVSPQGVGLYWLVNTWLSSAQTQYVRGQVAEEKPEYKAIYDAAQVQEEGGSPAAAPEVASAVEALGAPAAKPLVDEVADTRQAKRRSQAKQKREKKRASKASSRKA
eukprot:TRINITY_DN12558_c0_g1_i1.p1 TRINITY_DN12558_c0_g1~~TRINITY_DN12558_c0_g1_i1.p1  ORF type:complete len:440 (-),score=113.01 TRINITY_DN12558_c0_g1_i1:70-1389(-)